MILGGAVVGLTAALTTAQSATRMQAVGITVAAELVTLGMVPASAITRVGLTGGRAVAANIGAGGVINAGAGLAIRCGEGDFGDVAQNFAFGAFGSGAGQAAESLTRSGVTRLDLENSIFGSEGVITTAGNRAGKLAGDLVAGSGSQVSNFFNGLNGNASSEPNRRLNYNGL